MGSFSRAALLGGVAFGVQGLILDAHLAVAKTILFDFVLCFYPA